MIRVIKAVSSIHGSVGKKNSQSNILENNNVPMVYGSADARRPRSGQRSGPSWKPLIFEKNKTGDETRRKSSQ